MTFLPLLCGRILLFTPEISPNRWLPPFSSDFSPKPQPPLWDVSPRGTLGEKKVMEKARLVEGVAGSGCQDCHLVQRREAGPCVWEAWAW